MKCPRCGSHKLHKSTKVIRADKSKAQKYQCQSCGKYFLDNYASIQEYYSYVGHDYTIVEV
jgi:transposase-like protein